MIHQPSGGSRGVAADIEIQAQEILLLREQLNGLLASHTGQTPERIAQDTDRDYWMSPDAAQEYGLIDLVQRPRKPLAEASAE
jgi:ATP-dependent Clp protease protease subunit